MHNDTHMDSRDIGYFMAHTLSFFIFLSGLLFLLLNPETLSFMLGRGGSSINQFLFQNIGLSYFYLLLVPIHFNLYAKRKVTPNVVENTKFFLQFSLSHIVILALVSNFLGALGSLTSHQPTAALSFGLGGRIGQHTGNLLYSYIGIYGTLSLLATLLLGVMYLGDFLQAKEIFKPIFTNFNAKEQIAAKRNSITSMIKSPFFKKPTLSLATTSSSSTSTMTKKKAKASYHWSAKKMITDHFHIYPDAFKWRKSEAKEALTNSGVKKKVTKKTTKKTAAKKTATTSKKKTARKKVTAKKATMKKVTKKATKKASKTTTARKKTTRKKTRTSK